MEEAENTQLPYTILELSPASAETDLSAARELLLEYGRFVIAQPGAARFCFGTLEQEAAHLPQSFLEQGGGCLLAYAHSHAAGFVAWRTLPTTVEAHACEVKRLWVRPLARGLRLGRVLTQSVVDRVAAAGCRAVYLDTAPAAMAAAHRLYLDLGFEPCPPYNDNPVEGLAWLRKGL